MDFLPFPASQNSPLAHRPFSQIILWLRLASPWLVIVEEMLQIFHVMHLFAACALVQMTRWTGEERHEQELGRKTRLTTP